MRLSTAQQQIIKTSVKELIGPNAIVCVFGSQMDDSAIGGDVDLLIETPKTMSMAQKIQLSARLQQRLGTPVDIVVTTPNQQKPIANIARLTGTRL